MESEESVYKKKIKQGGKVCAAIKCQKGQYNSTVSLFTFPIDKEKVIVVGIQRMLLSLIYNVRT